MKNIILLAMSTLPSNRRVADDYSAPDGSVINNCESQLEPGCRYFMSLSPDVDSEFIILETDESKEDKSTEFSNMTAVEFFEDRIRHAQEKTGEVFFEDIDLNEKKPEEAIRKAVKQIRTIYSANNHDIRLFIVTNGGFRDISLVMNAIISLLRQEGIQPAGICGTNTRKKEIIDQTHAFNIFRFVTGMNDFINFGNADVLVNYYEDAPKPIVNAMHKIAIGTQICDANTYTEGLKELDEAIAAYKEDEEDDLFSIFVDDVKNDFGKYGLLPQITSNGTAEESSVTGVIERCVDKELYQQALTFLESMMPKYFFDKQILYYDETHEYQRIQTAKQADKQGRSKSDYNYVFDIYLLELQQSSDPEQIKRRIEQYSLAYRQTIANHMENCPVQTQVTGRFVFMENGRDSFVLQRIHGVRLYSKLSSGKYRQAGETIRIHNTLKQCRNLINHASTKERPKIEDIVNAMRFYILKVRYLEKSII